MSLIYSAITPHSPLLIKGVGKKNTELLQKTLDSFKRISEELYAAQVETIVVISSHTGFDDDTFSIALAPEIKINFQEFGDFSSEKKLPGDSMLAHKIKKELTPDFKTRVIYKDALNHGAGVPLYLLSEYLKEIKIVPVYCANASLEEHYNIGSKIKKAITKSNKRIAAIASGDLSHKITKNAPAGYSPKAAKFDQRIIKSLQAKENKDVINTKEELINEVETEGLRSISLFLGIMNKINYTPKLLSYEYPFGVGYLTMSFYL